MKRILFVCIENSNRSQMAQAFGKIYGEGKIESYSAGSRPSGKVNPKAVAAMKELGYDLSLHESKSLQEIPEGEYEYVITMGCGDTCPWMPAKHREDWAIPDPRDMEPDEFRKVRDMIGEKVRDLVRKIKD
jgi:arsenate reductase (thioredoxin)